MTDNLNQTTTVIEILGKPYTIRCPQTELASLQEAAALVNQEMTKVKDAGKAINIERIAIIAALNMAHQFLELNQLSDERSTLMQKVHQRIAQLQAKLNSTINKSLPAELVYSSE